MTTPSRADAGTREMALVHRALRRESGRFVGLVAAVRPGDTARAVRLSARLCRYRHRVAHHQQAEDDLLWPVLLARIDLEADVVLRMQAQHERVSATLAGIGAALPGWTATAGEEERDRLVAALAEHRAVLAAHLGEEETAVLPLARRHLADHEWLALHDRFGAWPALREQLAYLGAVLDQAGRADRALVLAGLPWRTRAAWHLAGRLHHFRC